MRTWDKLEKAGNSWRYRCCDRNSSRHRQCRTSHGVADKEARYQQVRPIRITSRHRRGQSEYARESLLHYAYLRYTTHIYLSGPGSETQFPLEGLSLKIPLLPWSTPVIVAPLLTNTREESRAASPLLRPLVEPLRRENAYPGTFARSWKNAILLMRKQTREKLASFSRVSSRDTGETAGAHRSDVSVGRARK